MPPRRCNNKRRYATEKQAEKTATKAHPGMPLVAFWCDKHQAWHLGHTDDPVRLQQRLAELIAHPPPLKRPEASRLQRRLMQLKARTPAP